MDPESTLAYHEAGHSVVAWSLNVPVRAVSIDGTKGRVVDALTPDRWHPETDYKKFETLGIVLWAGEMAERALDEGAEGFCSQDDHLELEVLAGRLFDAPDDRRNWKDQMKAMSRIRVVEHFERIRAVADALIQRKSLGEAELLGIVTAARWKSS